MNRSQEILRVVGGQIIRRPRIGLIGSWIVASMVGGLLGEILLRIGDRALGTVVGGPGSLIELMTWGLLGVGLGMAQAAVIGSLGVNSMKWIAATAIAVGLAFPISHYLAGSLLDLSGTRYLLVVTVGLGGSMGLVQSLILLHCYHGVFWWIMASMLGWPLEHFTFRYLARLTDRSVVDMVGWQELIGWALYGVLTGVVLVYGLRRKQA